MWWLLLLVGSAAGASLPYPAATLATACLNSDLCTRVMIPGDLPLFTALALRHVADAAGALGVVPDTADSYALALAGLEAESRACVGGAVAVFDSTTSSVVCSCSVSGSYCRAVPPRHTDANILTGAATIFVFILFIVLLQRGKQLRGLTFT